MLVQVLTALPITLLVGSLVARVFEARTSVVRLPLPLFSLAIFMGAWSGGLLTIPLQEMVWAVYWVSFFAGGMLIAMFVIMVSLIPGFRKSAEESVKPGTEQTRGMTLMDVFLSALSVLLAVLIVLYHIG